jgi:hypothetical protein
VLRHRETAPADCFAHPTERWLRQVGRAGFGPNVQPVAATGAGAIGTAARTDPDPHASARRKRPVRRAVPPQGAAAGRPPRNTGFGTWEGEASWRARWRGPAVGGPRGSATGGQAGPGSRPRFGEAGGWARQVRRPGEPLSGTTRRAGFGPSGGWGAAEGIARLAGEPDPSVRTRFGANEHQGEARGSLEGAPATTGSTDVLRHGRRDWRGSAGSRDRRANRTRQSGRTSVRPGTGDGVFVAGWSGRGQTSPENGLRPGGRRGEPTVEVAGPAGRHERARDSVLRYAGAARERWQVAWQVGSDAHHGTRASARGPARRGAADVARPAGRQTPRRGPASAGQRPREKPERRWQERPRADLPGTRASARGKEWRAYGRGSGTGASARACRKAALRRGGATREGRRVA